MEREREVAKEALRRDNKPLALLAIRRRKYQESLVEKTTQHLFNLEQLVFKNY